MSMSTDGTFFKVMNSETRMPIFEGAKSVLAHILVSNSSFIEEKTNEKFKAILSEIKEKEYGTTEHFGKVKKFTVRDVRNHLQKDSDYNKSFQQRFTRIFIKSIYSGPLIKIEEEEAERMLKEFRQNGYIISKKLFSEIESTNIREKIETQMDELLKAQMAKWELRIKNSKYI